METLKHRTIDGKIIELPLESNPLPMVEIDRRISILENQFRQHETKINELIMKTEKLMKMKKEN